MPYTLEFDIPKDVFEAVRDLSKSSGLMRRTWEQNLRGVSSTLYREITKPPGKVARPIEWQTPKQRRAYFATNGFGKGIPYKRTGKLQKGWKLEFDYGSNDGLLTLTNPADATIYVQGSLQQRMHRNTGWPRADEITDKYQRDFTEQTIEAWLIVAETRFQR